MNDERADVLVGAHRVVAQRFDRGPQGTIPQRVEVDLDGSLARRGIGLLDAVGHHHEADRAERAHTISPVQPATSDGNARSRSRSGRT